MAGIGKGGEGVGRGEWYDTGEELSPRLCHLLLVSLERGGSGNTYCSGIVLEVGGMVPGVGLSRFRTWQKNPWPKDRSCPDDLFPPLPSSLQGRNLAERLWS